MSAIEADDGVHRPLARQALIVLSFLSSEIRHTMGSA
jgi:hypothetical protein